MRMVRRGVGLLEEDKEVKALYLSKIEELRMYRFGKRRVPTQKSSPPNHGGELQNGTSKIYVNASGSKKTFLTNSSTSAPASIPAV